MMLGRLFRRRAAPPVETRSAGSYTAMVLAARGEYLRGASGVAEATATVQACVSLWEAAFAAADVTGADMLDRRSMGLVARGLALRGEAVFKIGDRLVPCSDWDLSTRDGEPRAYRLSIPEAGGGRTETVLAAEVLHFRIGSDAASPWVGQAPLRRAQLSSELLAELESALTGVFRDAPLGSMIVPIDAGGGEALESVRGNLRGRRGGALVIEHLSQAIAGGAPTPGRGPDRLSPAIRDSMAIEAWAAARDAICGVYGVLPALLSSAATGPLVREAQRHLAVWTLQPVAELIAEEASAKLGATVSIDTITPLQAFDQGGSARALMGIIQALAAAKDSGIDVGPALKSLDWVEIGR